MPRYSYDWGDEDNYVLYTTRHLPKALHHRLMMLAAAKKESVEMVLNQCLDRGLFALERDQRR